MIVYGRQRVDRREVARGGYAATFPTRVGSTSSGTGRGPAARASASFFNLRSTRRLWMRMTHRYATEARTGALSPARAPFLPYTPARKRVRLSVA